LREGNNKQLWVVAGLLHFPLSLFEGSFFYFLSFSLLLYFLNAKVKAEKERRFQEAAVSFLP